jgi:hypothetical protein
MREPVRNLLVYGDGAGTLAGNGPASGEAAPFTSDARRKGEP